MEQLSFDIFSEEKSHYSVTELTREIKFLLENQFFDVWVEGEISNFKHHSSGHMYFCLKDENSQISCAMWRSRNQNLFFMPQDGMKVMANGRISLFEKRGVYQLDVLHIQPAGVGALQMAFEQLKNRLREEGLFATEHKKPLPQFPERIGIVTSPTGAAIRDMLHVLQRRFPAIDIILNPVHVQGDGAALEIANAIDEFNEYGEIDVLIVGRGGGSLEDLWAFNEEIVARAIFRSKIPVVSAVGHEVDFSISDFVADLRAPTPSAAAELVVPNKEDLKITLQYYSENMTASLLDRIKYYRERLQTIQNGYGFRQPLDVVMQYHQRLDEIKRTLNNCMMHKIALCREMLNSHSKRLALLQHDRILERGYSLCYRRADGKLINNAADLQESEEIEVSFYRGKAIGTVNEIIK